MAKTRHVLGLHTLDEQAIALRMATEAFEGAVVGSKEQDVERVAFFSGYVNALRDLAMAEGADGLVRDLDVLLRRLGSMSR